MQDPSLKEKDLLIYGSCIENVHPQILDRLSEGKTALHICLEAEHVSLAEAKLLHIITYSKPKSVTVLTMDGSPHCVQLHFAVEQLRKAVEIPIRHLVIEKGEVFEVSPEAVRAARHLSEVEKLLRGIKP